MKTFKQHISEASTAFKNSRGIARHKMPQIKSSDVPAFVSWMKGNGTTIKKQSVAIGKLKPTQKEYNREKVDTLKTIDKSNLIKPIIVASDMHILDGHHRYLALLELDKTYKIQIVHVGLTIDELVDAAEKFPKSSIKGINESLDTPYKHTSREVSRGIYRYQFTTDASKQGLIMIDISDGVADINFTVGGSMELTGDSDGLKVLATVRSAIEHFMSKESPIKLFFSADKSGRDASRQRLYKRLAGKIAKKYGMRLSSRGAVFGDDLVFVLEK